MALPAGGEGHHDGRLVPGTGAGPSQGAGRPLGSRLSLHAGQHHRPLADLLARRSQPVRLQGECRQAEAALLLSLQNNAADAAATTGRSHTRP